VVFAFFEDKVVTLSKKLGFFVRVVPDIYVLMKKFTRILIGVCQINFTN